jgi:acylphosphatase
MANRKWSPSIRHSPFAKAEAHMGDVRTVRVRISGRVQGVGYRAWIAEAALDQAVWGWVRNRRDGTVEALFAGAPEDVAEMLRRCRQGPRGAVVTAVEILAEGEDAPGGFEVLETE